MEMINIRGVDVDRLMLIFRHAERESKGELSFECKTLAKQLKEKTLMAKAVMMIVENCGENR